MSKRKHDRTMLYHILDETLTSYIIGC